jgi:hypothetical protein
MATTIVGMPFRKEIRTESGECWVSDTPDDITPNEHAIVSRPVEAASRAMFEKRLH